MAISPRQNSLIKKEMKEIALKEKYLEINYTDINYYSHELSLLKQSFCYVMYSTLNFELIILMVEFVLLDGWMEEWIAYPEFVILLRSQESNPSLAESIPGLLKYLQIRAKDVLRFGSVRLPLQPATPPH
jgi:hypothetical protein